MDERFRKLTADLILNAKGFFDYGIKGGLITPNDMKLTIAKRQETAKALIDGGMSTRKAAKVLGVDAKTVRRDLGQKAPKSGAKSPGKKPKKATSDELDHILTNPRLNTNSEDRKEAFPTRVMVNSGDGRMRLATPEEEEATFAVASSILNPIIHAWEMATREQRLTFARQYSNDVRRIMEGQDGQESEEMA